jgi:hypothetical protein
MLGYSRTELLNLKQLQKHPINQVETPKLQEDAFEKAWVHIETKTI